MAFFSCNNDASDTCDCQSDEFKTINLKVGNDFHQFKQYSDPKLNFEFIYRSFSLNKESSEKLLSQFEINDIDYENIVTLTFFIENGYNKMKEKQLLNNENVNGILIYIKDQKSEILTTFVYHKNKNYELVKDTKLKSIIVSSNDIYEISKSFINLKNVSSVSFIDFSRMPKNKSIITELQDVLKAKKGEKEMQSYCNFPCQATPDGWCTASESQSGGEHWWCLGDPRACGVEELEYSILSKSGYNFNILEIKDELYLFRDEYLLNKKGGQQTIEKYYTLSKNIDPKNITIEYSVETFELLETIIPLLRDLRVNQNSFTKILIDQPTSDVLIAHLEKSKKLFNDKQSKKTIDDLKNIIKDFTNKPNSYISLKLDTYVFEE